ncbi:MAG: glycosyltransferase family 2 protein [Paracoccaceae bacterium]
MPKGIKIKSDSHGLSPDPTPQPRVAVLMCTLDGSAYIRQQLGSIFTQSLRPSEILISDDGSTDQTRQILTQIAHAHPAARMRISEGPQRGYSANFFKLLTRVSNDVDFVALADQDDVWLKDKLARACKALEGFADRPALYGSATIVCDANLNNKYLSRAPDTKVGFGHALAQNFAGGNTMVLNAAALALVQDVLGRNISVPVYDWFLYQLISGAGGEIVFDGEPSLLYRQHARNAIGAVRGIRPRLWRLRHLTQGRYRRWNDANLKALTQVSDLLSPTHRRDLRRVCEARTYPLIPRLRLLWRSRIRRFSIEGFLALWVAVVLNQF